MSKIVIDISKGKGMPGGRLDEHLDRRHIATNVDASRTHLNQVLVAPAGGSRRAAVDQRIAAAGIRRKVRPDAVTHINIVLSGSHEKMKSLEQEGRLDDWATDSVEWLRNTFGGDNVVSAYLHVDERTPHIHACVVPIVRKKSKKSGETVACLSSKDVLKHYKYAEYWTSYAQCMAKYGLERGDTIDRDIATDELVNFYQRAKKIDKQAVIRAEAKIAKASSLTTNIAAFLSTAASTAGRKMSGQRQREEEERRMLEKAVREGAKRQKELRQYLADQEAKETKEKEEWEKRIKAAQERAERTAQAYRQYRQRRGGEEEQQEERTKSRGR